VLKTASFKQVQRLELSFQLLSLCNHPAEVPLAAPGLPKRRRKFQPTFAPQKKRTIVCAGVGKGEADFFLERAAVSITYLKNEIEQYWIQDG
jgi:hypothetical protein